jgi:hypothetical protein
MGSFESGMTASLWYFVTYEVSLNGGYMTDINFYIDDGAAASVTIANFAIDLSANDAYFGAQWDGAAYSNRWNGYFFNFFIIQGAGNSALYRTNNFATGCGEIAEGCWVADYN